MTLTTKRPDEETPLLAQERAEVPVERKRSPIPWGQFSILLILQLAEPLTSQLISPFAPQVSSEYCELQTQLNLTVISLSETWG